MKFTKKNVALKSIVAAAALLATGAAMAQFGNDPASINGPSLGTISGNVAASLGGVSRGFEAFLYFLGVLFIVLFLLALWKNRKTDGREGSAGMIATFLLLSVFSFAAPTLLGSASSTVFGDSPRQGIQAPSTTPNFN